MKLLIPLILMLWTGSAFANIDDSRAIRAVLGEAGQSYVERLAIAHAIRNRGTLQGVYGHLKAPSEAQWQAGSRAWFEALDTPDPTKNAKFWLSDYDLKHCRPSLIAWHKRMTETAYIGHTHFYAEKA